jgi:hypothetical protein
MKNLFKPLVALAMLTGSFINAEAQKNDWKQLTEEGGVIVSWRWKQLYRNAYVSEVRLENRNDYLVEVTLLPAFTCPDGIEYKQAGVVVTVEPRSVKTGERDGLAFYPCQGEKIPRKVMLEKLKVTRKTF